MEGVRKNKFEFQIRVSELIIRFKMCKERNCIETYNRQQVQKFGSEVKSGKIKKEMKSLMERYRNIGNNEFFISCRGYTLEFCDDK